MFNTKPKSVKFDLEELAPKEIEYFCKTGVIDEMVMRELKLPFDKQLSEELAKDVRFYLVIDKARRYDVISGVTFEKYLKDNDINLEPVKTAKATACINHFVKHLVEEHTKAAAANFIKQRANPQNKKNVN